MTRLGEAVSAVKEEEELEANGKTELEPAVNLLPVRCMISTARGRIGAGVVIFMQDLFQGGAGKGDVPNDRINRYFLHVNMRKSYRVVAMR